MRVLIFGTLAVVGVVSSILLFASFSEVSKGSTFLKEVVDYETEFSKFISKHQKQYKCKEEYLMRFENFKSNLDYINAHNSIIGSRFGLGVNYCADEKPLHSTLPSAD